MISLRSALHGVNNVLLSAVPMNLKNSMLSKEIGNNDW